MVEWPDVDWVFVGFLGRMVLINVMPFFLVFHLVMRRRRQFLDKKDSELGLVGDEIKIVGILGYVVILSIYFFSIPVLRYLKTKPGYDILLVEPDGFTVFLIAFLSFTLVVASIYLKAKRRWAYDVLSVLSGILLLYAFFSVLEWGCISGVPVTLFAYICYRLSRPGLKREIGEK